MKIRKILPLLLLAIGSVFLLSSCDAMLDAIFSNNTIGIDVSTSIGTYRYYPSLDVVSVSVLSGLTSVATANAAYTGNSGSYMFWSVTIPKLSDGNYTVTVNYHSYYLGSPPFSQSQTLSLPLGSSHSVNLQYNFN